MQLHEGFLRVAHDPGDPMLTSHCPMCGSGQVFGRSDGNIECDFCGAVYIVRIQPAFSGMPQLPGGPGAPSDIGPDGMPMDPGMGMPPGAGGEMPPGEEEGGDLPPFMEDGDGGDEEGDEEDGSDEDEEAPPFPPKGKKASRRQAAQNHGDMSDPELRRHMRDRHGFQDSPEDPDWLIDETHREEHADAPREHSHPDLEAEHDLDLPLGDKDWLGQHGIQAARRTAATIWTSCCDRPMEGDRCPGCGSQVAVSGFRGARQDVAYPVIHGITQADIDPGRSSQDDEFLKEHGIQASRQYRTAAGDMLPEGAFIRHLAVLHSGSAPAVLAALRTAAPSGRAKYTGDYTRGWNSSKNWSGDGRSPLERADGRGEGNAWYEGYEDHTASRPKFHSRDCPAEGDHGRAPDCTLTARASRRTADLRGMDRPTYTGHYTRGWNASVRAGSWSGNGPSALDRADDKREPGAWYDGYLDHATDRPKFHSRECPARDHENDPACPLVAEILEWHRQRQQRQGARPAPTELGIRPRHSNPAPVPVGMTR